MKTSDIVSIPLVPGVVMDGKLYYLIRMDKEILSVCDSLLEACSIIDSIAREELKKRYRPGVEIVWAVSTDEKKIVIREKTPGLVYGSHINVVCELEVEAVGRATLVPYTPRIEPGTISNTATPSASTSAPTSSTRTSNVSPVIPLVMAATVPINITEETPILNNFLNNLADNLSAMSLIPDNTRCIANTEELPMSDFWRSLLGFVNTPKAVVDETQHEI